MVSTWEVKYEMHAGVVRWPPKKPGITINADDYSYAMAA